MRETARYNEPTRVRMMGLKGDEMFSNGVVHHIDAMLMPSKEAAANAPALGEKAGQ